ncbi:MAG: DUF2911 domain-containing protein [Bacteroidota bacterium]
MLRPRVLPLLALPLALLLLLPTPTQAQDLHPSRRLSPIGITRADVGEAYVKVTYGRPYMRNRTVYGELVPYGQVWRTGANEDTEITVTEDVMVAGERLAAGTYTLYTVPGEAEWEVRFSPQVGLWARGIFDPNADPRFTANVYDESQDALRISVPSGSLDEPVDPFTINLQPMDDGSHHLVMSWADTEVRVPFTPAG